MANFIYLGTGVQVNADRTRQLLEEWRAIWCPPPRLRPWQGTPNHDDHVWLCWAESAGANEMLVLGCGKSQENPDGPRYGSEMLWTNRDIPGVTPAAERLGYGGGTGMSFLKLNEGRTLVLPQYPSVAQRGTPSGLSEVTDDALLGDLQLHCNQA